MTREQLLKLLKQGEDNFVERKTTHSRDVVVKALVAFANSLPLDREAVLFIGVRDDGQVAGVANPANVQKDVQTWARDVCFPPIGVRCEILTDTDSRPVVAVVVSPSKDRPHFAGPAYVREANKSVKASQRVFDELVASRNEKAGVILRHKGEVVTVLFQVPQAPPPDTVLTSHTIYVKESLDGLISNCSAHHVEIELVGYGQTHSIPLVYVTLATDPKEHNRLKLIVDGLYRTMT